MSYINSVRSASYTAPVQSLPTELEQKVEAAKTKVAELETEQTALLTTIDKLKARLPALGLRPNLAIRYDRTFDVSQAEEPLGSLETKINQLEKDNNYYKIVVGRLQSQIEMAEKPDFDRKVEATKEKINQLTQQADRLKAEIQALKAQGYKLIFPPFVHGGVIGSLEKEPLKSLEIQMHMLQKQVRMLEQERSKLVLPS